MSPAQFHFHPALSPQYRLILYSTHWCFHNTQSFHNSVFPLLEHPSLVPGPSSYSQCQEQQVNSQMHYNGTISSTVFATWCYTDTECNVYTQMVHPVTILNFWWFPSSKFQHCRSDWCAEPFQDDTVHVISTAINSQ